ncbi:MYG1 family protein [Paeniroseomonas aquatica]|uniref:MYG1 family protein n=1 Tax=Paeniroseomonas aquatica TaxID=373043 RepID=UPI00361EF778
MSAAGLVWRHHGEAAVAALLGSSGADVALVAQVAAEIDRDVVRRIDEIDHGENHPEDTLGLSSVVEDCNLRWNTPATGDQAAEDAAFLRASEVVEGFLRRRMEAVHARLAAMSVVLEAHRGSADPRIMEIDRKMPWQDPVFEYGLPVLYAVYPVATGNWMVDAMPPERGSYAQRLPLPEAWAGLLDAALVEASGIPDAVFVHRERFVGAARSRAGALAMARRAMEIGSATLPRQEGA